MGKTIVGHANWGQLNSDIRKDVWNSNGFESSECANSQYEAWNHNISSKLRLKWNHRSWYA